MTQIIILAGGKGTRMKSECPKVLTKVNGAPMLKHLLENITPLCPQPTIIVGYKGEEVIKQTDNKYHYVWQKEQLGTGHAVRCAQADLRDRNLKNIIVLPGDHPFISNETILSLIEARNKNNAVIYMATVNTPHFIDDFECFYNYGRIIRGDDKEIKAIVEVKDATWDQKLISEVNISQYCFDADWLWENIDKLENNNNAKEYYLTDMVKIAINQGNKVNSIGIKNIKEGFGANTPDELKILEKYFK